MRLRDTLLTCLACLGLCGCATVAAPPLAVGERFQDCPTCPQMVVVPAGSFTMGSPPDELGRRDDEGPQRTVTIARPFAVGVYEVTVAEWNACVADGACRASSRVREGDLRRVAVRGVSWHDAQLYVEWLSVGTGQRYRLPSEAEWEYFARAGATTPFHTGWMISMAQANYDGRITLGSAHDGGYYRGQVLPVGSFAPNAWGVHDVHGNVGEWVHDCWHDSYAGAPTDGSAWESPNCRTPVSRGGFWYRKPSGVRAARRHSDDRRSGNGLRVVRRVDVEADQSKHIAEDVVPGESDRSALAGRKPRGPDHVDAELLALRTLHRVSNDLLPDEDRLAELSNELAGVLVRLKETYPEFAGFRVRPWLLGVLEVRLDYDFALAVRDALQRDTPKADRAAIVRTGHKAFDELNERMGLRHIDQWGIDRGGADGDATFHLHELANLRAAARAYSALDVVESAEPSGYLPYETPNIDVFPMEEGWFVTVLNVWGDCPAGCINREEFRFRAAAETLQRIDREGSPKSPTLERW